MSLVWCCIRLRDHKTDHNCARRVYLHTFAKAVKTPCSNGEDLKAI